MKEIKSHVIVEEDCLDGGQSMSDFIRSLNRNTSEVLSIVYEPENRIVIRYAEEVG